MSVIGEELYKIDSGQGLYPGHRLYEAAKAKRYTRWRGRADGETNTFRNIDLYPASQTHFLGLAEVWETSLNDYVYVVRLGPPQQRESG